MADRGGDKLVAALAKPQLARFELGLELPTLARMIANSVRPKDLSVVASFAKHGKSALLEQLALDVSQEHLTMVAPLEMREDPTWLRLGAKIAKQSPAIVEAHGIGDDERRELNLRRLLVRAPREGEKWSISQIETEIMRERPAIVMIDHVKWIEGWDEGSMVPTRMVTQLKNLAIRTSTHIMLAAQIKPEDYGKRPGFWRIQDTSAISQVVSLEMLIHRPFYGRGADDDIAEIVVRNNRWGPAGVVHVRWVGETQTFWHMSRDDFENARCTCKRRKGEAA